MTTQDNQNKRKTITAHSILNRNLWSGMLCGLGLVAFIDETLFHQLLQWHYFYDKSTAAIGLFSDGVFHAFSWFSSICGMFMLANLRQYKAWLPKRWYGGVLLGGGLFQLYDGIIQHKLMRLHQIRYVDQVIIYDMVWNVVAVVMILFGAFMLKNSKRGSLKIGE